MEEPSSTPQKKIRPPAWSTDELILALDLYLRNPSALNSKDHPDVQELSIFLGKMALPSIVERLERYRSADAVYMKLHNFKRWDPKYTQVGKRGLKNGNREEERVWTRFAEDPEKLADVVIAIRSFVGVGLSSESTREVIFSDSEPEIQEAEEGKILTRFHRFRERDRKLVLYKKKQAMSKYGKLDCEACGFSFLSRYGDAGKDIIDVHHTKPLHTLKPGEKTRLNDLALLCSNCHRVVHSSKPWLTIEELRKALVSG
ncbi:HNH endonuclease [Pseudomonas putida]|uniref:HNH endonuclease n=1 Tax=Pseudomonas putida TaxID=303 RepID=UPI0023633FF5|nr:HNH endonuclease [Pseudomonas putida]MDD2068727.1 HNH endonuclease [Pseudomonas putida]